MQCEAGGQVLYSLNRPLVVLMATMFLSGMPGTMPSALACRTRPKEPSPVEAEQPSVDSYMVSHTRLASLPSGKHHYAQ